MNISDHVPSRAEALDIAYTDLAALTNPSEIAIARKAILQTQVLGYRDDELGFDKARPQSIGIFRVLPTVAAIDWATPSQKYKVASGETYLDFHMPKSDGLTNQSADESYAKIAEYMKTDPDILSIMGVTYEVMARSAKQNQGFNTEEIDLPEAIMSYASAFWQNMMPDIKPKRFESAHIVWQKRGDFIDRFGSN